MDYLLNLLYVYLFGCAFLTMLFGAEWALNWWMERERKRLDDNPFR